MCVCVYSPRQQNICLSIHFSISNISAIYLSRFISKFDIPNNCPEIHRPRRVIVFGLADLHQLFRLEEPLQMAHLPESHANEDDGLDDRPPQHSAVCALACEPETLLPVLAFVHTKQESICLVTLLFIIKKKTHKLSTFAF